MDLAESTASGKTLRKESVFDVFKEQLAMWFFLFPHSLMGFFFHFINFFQRKMLLTNQSSIFLKLWKEIVKYSATEIFHESKVIGFCCYCPEQMAPGKNHMHKIC